MGTIEAIEGIVAGCVVDDNVVLCFVEGEGIAELVVLGLDTLVVLELVALDVVNFVVDVSRAVLMLNVDCDVGIGIRGMVVLAPKPVVVVTTATLHSTCIALPSLNSPIMLVSSTSAAWQLLATSALV